MALPKIDKLSSEFTVSENDSGAIKQEIVKLGESIQESSSMGLKAATQAVVGNVPEMIKSLTQEIETGSISSFAIAMNKLIKLTEDLGINLRDYNEELADTVERFTGEQTKLQEELGKLREQGIKAEIDQEKGRIKLLTQNDILEYNKEKQINEESIRTNKEDIETRLKLLNLTDEELKAKEKNRDEIETEIKSRADANKELEATNQRIDEKTGTTADTGFSGNDQGFSKLTELKEAFMVIPDTIADAFGQFANVGKKAFSGFMTFLGAPLKTIGKMFKSIANIFKTARIMIALKVLAVIAAFQWVAENIDMIAGVFVNIWNKITGFFKDIVDWFKNSAVGKFFGLGGEEGDDQPNRKGYNKMTDETTYEVGEGTQIQPTTLPGQKLASNDPELAVVVDPVTKEIIKPGEPGYEKAKERRNQTIQSYSADEQEVNAMNELRSVVGDNVDDEQTSKMLKSLEAESQKVSSNNVVNIQNNSNVNSNSSNASNVSGFIDHEPDTSFKYVRRSNGDEYI